MDETAAQAAPTSAPERVALPSTRQMLRRVRDALRALVGRKTFEQSRLIATLNEVADAVTSQLSVEQVLDAVVERAKSITDTDKALLLLVDEHTGELDHDTIVVRGRRVQHLQEWWEGRLEAIAEQVFHEGGPVIEAHPSQQALILAAPLLVKDRAVGMLCAINSSERPFTGEQVEFAEVLSAFAASAIENARLAEASRYSLLASERDRIAREMHDGVVQSLFSISLGLEVCKRQVARDPMLVSVRIEDLQQQLNAAMTELRRLIYDLRPMKLTELGLIEAIEYWVREVTQSRAIRGKVVATGQLPRLTPDEEACLYRVAKEAVSNVVRHARAASFEVRLEADDGVVRLCVTDDGRGFDANEMLAGATEGLGLRSIQQRVARANGTLRVLSAPESGTSLVVELPVAGERR